MVDDKKFSVSSVTAGNNGSSPCSGDNLGQAASVTLPFVEQPISSSSPEHLVTDTEEEEMIDHSGIVDLVMKLWITHLMWPVSWGD